MRAMLVSDENQLQWPLRYLDVQTGFRGHRLIELTGFIAGAQLDSIESDIDG
jgi:hypothetical protein